MQGVLIDDHRIHVDFSQSVRRQCPKLEPVDSDSFQVSRLSDSWRTATNSKRTNQSGGFGGVANLEKKRQYRAVNPDGNTRSRISNGYDMVHDKDELRRGQRRESDKGSSYSYPSRSRSPRRKDHHSDRAAPRRDDGRTRHRSPDPRPKDYDRNRRRF